MGKLNNLSPGHLCKASLGSIGNYSQSRIKFLTLGAVHCAFVLHLHTGPRSAALNFVSSASSSTLKARLAAHAILWKSDSLVPAIWAMATSASMKAEQQEIRFSGNVAANCLETFVSHFLTSCEVHFEFLELGR